MFYEAKDVNSGKVHRINPASIVEVRDADGNSSGARTAIVLSVGEPVVVSKSAEDVVAELEPSK